MFLKPKDPELNILKDKAVHKSCFLFFDRSLALYSDSGEVYQAFEKMYQSLRIDEQPEPQLTCYIIKNPSTTANPCVIINNKTYPLPEDESFLFYAEMLIFQALFNLLEDYFMLHAGVVSRGERGFIISGPSGFGKTTLTLELVSRGYKFLSDEYCPVSLDDYHIMPFPRSLSLKKDNRFLAALGRHTSCYPITRNKVIISSEDVFPGSKGSSCKACALILLKGITNSNAVPGNKLVELALFNHRQELIDKLCCCEGITLIEKFPSYSYMTYRFSLNEQGSLTKVFDNVCSSYENEIFYQTVLFEDKPAFGSSPTIKPVTTSDASLEILKNLLNRSPQSGLLKRFSNKHSLLLLKIADFLKHINCYEIKPGRLPEMADIIDSL